ncbi:MAG: hypothetical protein JXR83_15050 [Deltaproteobacteria bacterium]|nr:hypothetical protein [Deltaproteobacteria bacterium]
MSESERTGEPLPIWFFVGVILAVYGGLVMLSDLVPAGRLVVLAELHAPIWWGAITLVCGAVFLVIGIRAHRLGRQTHEQK